MDANVLIEAHDAYYPFDICPAYWEWLIDRNRVGRIFSIKEVQREIFVERKEAGSLKEWMKRAGKTFFPGSGAAVDRQYERIRKWAEAQNYTRAAVEKFFLGADPYLIAHASVHGFVVVTQEIRADTRRKIKIPDVCDGLGVTCVNVFEMLRETGAWFVLGESRKAA